MSGVMRGQVGGDHYKKLAVQPVTYAMVNGYDGCCFNIAKYLMRNKGDRVKDLEKAKHYVDLRLELDWPCRFTPPQIGVYELVSRNGYDPQGLLSKALHALADFQWRTTMIGAKKSSEALKAIIDLMIVGERFGMLDCASYASQCRELIDTSFAGDNDARVNVIGQNGNDGGHYVKR